MRIVMTRRLPGGAEELARSSGHEVWIYGGEGAIPRDLLLERAADADALITLLTDRVDDPLLAAAPGLKVVANYAVGFDNIDVAACRERGVVATNTPDVLNEATADLAWALLMAASRRLVEGHKMVASGGFGGWAPDLLLGQDVWGTTLGIFGAGRIGRAMGRRGAGFEMRLLYADEVPWEEGEARWGAERVDWETLLGESDFLSLHAPLLPSTAKIMDAGAFARMKPTAVLVNAARGGLVDEGALLAALETGQIFAAGLDVFDPEPPMSDNPLLRHPRVVLAPHTGSATTGARGEMGNLAVRNALAVLAGEPAITPIS